MAEKRKLLKIAGWLLLSSTLILHVYLAWHLKNYIREGYADFTIFYSAGSILREGPRSNLYDPALQYQVQKKFAPNVKIRQAALPYNHPPFEALLFVPLTWFSYVNAYVIWNLVNLSIFCAIPILLREHIPILQMRPPWFWGLIACAFFPTFMTLIQGQDSILLLLIIVVTFVFLKRNADFASGCYLALGLFRFHLVLPLALLLLLRGRRKAIFGFVSIAVLLLMVSAGLVGWSTVLHYPQYVMRLEVTGAGGAIVPANMPTIHGLVDPVIGAPLGKIASGVVVATVSCALLLIAVLCWSNKGERGNFDLSFSLVVLITVLVSYHAYAHDLSLLFLPLLLVANHLWTVSTINQKIQNMLAPMFLLCLSPLYMFLWFYYHHLNLLGSLLLWWTLVLWQEIRRQSKISELRGAY